MFIIEHDKLKVGDVILTSENSAVSKTVRLATLSRYSHAMIWIDDTIIHSDSGGVYSQNAQRIIFKKRSHVKVLRLKENITNERFQCLVDFCRSQVGKEYSIREAIAIGYPVKPPATELQFCSRLVAQAYAKAELKIVDDFNYCSPGDINTSKLFVEVTNCVRPATKEDVFFAETSDPNQRTREDTMKMFKGIRAKFGRHLQTLSEVTQHLVNHPQDDAEITRIALESGYFDHAEVDILRNPWRYNESEFLIYCSENELNVTSQLKFIHDVGNATARVHVNELKQHENLFNRTQIQFFKHQVKLYKQLLNTHLLRQDLALHIYRKNK